MNKLKRRLTAQVFKKDVWEKRLVIVHCTDTPEGREVDVSEVDKWHKLRGFEMVGYHLLIKLDGTIQKGRDLMYEGAHTKGYNQHIGVCYVGRTKPNKKQLEALREIFKLWDFGIPLNNWRCHNEFTKKKTCPGFSREQLYKYLEEE